MKKIFEENKIYFGIGVLVLIFGILLLWPQNSREQKPETRNENETEIVGLRQRAEAVDWGSNEIELPKKMQVLKSKSSFINGDKLTNLLKSLGMEGVGATRSDSYYVIYENKEATLTVKLKERQIDYLIKRKLSYLGEKDKTKAVKNFTELMGVISNRKITSVDVEYFKDEYRATRTTVFKADFMQLSANFLYNDTPVLSYHGLPSIKAQYGFDGQLGRLMIFNPFDELVDDSEKELITADQVKQITVSKLPIFDIKGNREFAMSTGEENISVIKRETDKIAFVYEPLKNIYVPYLVVGGNTQLKSGRTEITFGVPIVKNDE